MGRRSARSERGASLVEAALVTPVFILLVFGIFEFGLLLRSHLTVSTATLEAARSASVGGNTAPADFMVLRSLEHGLEAIGTDNLVQVVVFRADSADDPVPGKCLGGSLDEGPGGIQCNQYTAADFALPYSDASGSPTGNWGCGDSARDRAWCPLDRETSLEDGAEPDFVGIYVEARHEYVTGMFNDVSVLTDTTIVRLEPKNARS